MAAGAKLEAARAEIHREATESGMRLMAGAEHSGGSYGDGPGSPGRAASVEFSAHPGMGRRELLASVESTSSRTV